MENTGKTRAVSRKRILYGYVAWLKTKEDGVPLRKAEPQVYLTRSLVEAHQAMVRVAIEIGTRSEATDGRVRAATLAAYHANKHVHERYRPDELH